MMSVLSSQVSLSGLGRPRPWEAVIKLGADVGGQPVEHVLELFDLLVGYAAAEATVELDRCGAQPRERRLARLGQLEQMDSPIGGVSAAGDQPVASG